MEDDNATLAAALEAEGVALVADVTALDAAAGARLAEYVDAVIVALAEMGGAGEASVEGEPTDG